MASRPSIAPFEYRDGRLCLEGLDLASLAAEELHGGAAWLLSHASIAAALAASARRAPAGPRCIAVGDIGPPVVLAQIAAAGWWARVGSAHELFLALAAGFPAARLVAAGGVREDGFVKDALSAGVAVLEHADADARANAARIAALLGQALPPEGAAPVALPGVSPPFAGAPEFRAPPAASPRLLAHCGGLLAPVLRPGPTLAIDAGWRRVPGTLAVWPLVEGAARERGSLAGLGGSQVPRPGGAARGLQPALIPVGLRRGDWVVIPGPAAAVRPPDPVHRAPVEGLVRAGALRVLAPRPLPPSSD